MNPRIFIGPMSKNVVDAAIACANKRQMPLGLIPSRRQVDYNSGYVNHWTTDTFSKYVKSQSKFILLERDHGGPSQGAKQDPGYDSFCVDCNYLDVVHIDPWKEADSHTWGTDLTKEYLEFCYRQNPRLRFEVGTEQAIYEYSADQLEWMLARLQHELPYIFDNVIYAVIQSGTAIQGTQNVGTYSEQRLKDMIAVCQKYGLKSKEHNGDYLNISDIKNKFDLGLDAINIAPEFGVTETDILLEHIEKSGNDKLLLQFYDLCFASGKWKKWMPVNYLPKRRWGVGTSTSDEIKKIIRVSGHYVFSDQQFRFIIKKLQKQYPSIQEEIKNRLMMKINALLDLC